MSGLKLLCFVTGFSVAAAVPIVLQGPWGPSAHKLFAEIAKRLVDVTGDRRAGGFLAQRISIAIQRGKAASILGTIPQGPVLDLRSSPSGETVIAISSSDPNVEKYISFNFPNKSEGSEDMNLNPGNPFQKTFSTAVAGTNTSTGRGFGSFNPLFLPFFNFPSFEGFGLNFGPWMRGVESQPMGNGEVKTITAINDNGHVYGKVKTVAFDNAHNKNTQ